MVTLSSGIVSKLPIDKSIRGFIGLSNLSLSSVLYTEISYYHWVEYLSHNFLLYGIWNYLTI